MEVTALLLYLLSAISAYTVYLIRERFNYWKIRGIPHDEPHLIFGNMKGVSKNRHVVDPVNDLYNKYKASGPFCGLYRFLMNPGVVVTEIDLVKKILIKDFNNFVDRGTFHNERDDPLSAHLFAIDGNKWRQLRSKLTSTFTSGKMKFMFKTVLEVGNRFAEVLGNEIEENGDVVEIKDINARFTTDVIGTCAFGIECNSLKDPNAQFREYGRKIFEKRHHRFIMGMMQSCPNLARKLRMKVIRNDIEEFFMKVVRDTVAHREREHIRRNDFMDILIDLKNNNDERGEDGISVEEIAAQTFVFFIAGFDTSSSTMSNAMYEMARNPDIQEKVRIEVNEVLGRHKGEITYESLGEMHYLGQVIDETLRMYPILGFLQRRALEDYETGTPNYKIDKGTVVFIPAEAIHHDQDLYPNPKKFIPERFTVEEKQKRDSCSYLPFGEGPRNCIGLRFGKMQTKIGLALMLKNFRFSVCEKTQIPLKFDPKQFLRQTLDGIYLKIERVL